MRWLKSSGHAEVVMADSQEMFAVQLHLGNASSAGVLPSTAMRTFD